MIDQITTEVLIIGAGAAGIRAALAASEAGVEVILLNNGAICASGSTFSPITKGWGIQALIGKERTQQNLEAFYNEIVQIGLGKSNSALAGILVEESGPRLEDLISYGIRFKKDAQGNMIRVKGCFSNFKRAFLTKDFANLKQSFQSALRRANVKIVSGTAVDLITRADACWGCLAVTAAFEPVKITAKSTIMTSGGGAGIYTNHLTGDKACGTGYHLAHQVGGELTNLEFIQFMLGIKKRSICCFFPTSSLQTPGTLLDSYGNDLLNKTIPSADFRLQAVENRQSHVPFSCRDTSYLIDKAIAEENREGGPICWNTPEDSSLKEVVHVAHAFNGGIKIDEKAESTLPGLYAAGEAAAGPHGADRIGGCMMTATQVFGERAGRFAAQRAKNIKQCPYTNEKPPIFKLRKKAPDQNSSINRLKKDACSTISKHVMILRNQEGLIRCRKNLQQIQQEADTFGWWDMKDLSAFLALHSILTVGRLVTDSALANPVSIGSHFRTDSPAKSIIS